MSGVSEFFQNKTIFLTGATGFLGQAILEKILWVAPEVKQLCLLIRPKRQSGGGLCPPHERLEKEVLKSSVFDRLRMKYGDRCDDFLRGKMTAVAGDISEKEYGIDPEMRLWLHQEVDVVINSAALVSFDAPLDDALEQNVISVQRLIEFTRGCRKAVLVHVSTAYVSGATNESIPETSYHAVEAAQGASLFPARKFTNVERDTEHVQQIIRQVHEEAHRSEVERELKQALLRHFKQSRSGKNVRRREKIENLRKKWIKNRLISEGMKWARQRGWNDTYTYTKAMGEQVITSGRGDIPAVIIRPSVIESSLAEPNPGWLDGLRMADPLIAAIGKGRLRSLPLNPEVIIDLVPVDLVVNALLASVPQIAREGGLQIYQVATGSPNPITLGQLYDLIFRYFRKNPLLDKFGKPIKIKPLKFPNRVQFRIQHRLKSMPLRTAERTLERLPSSPAAQRFKRKISAAKAAYEKLYYYGEIYEPYLNLDCRFEVDNTVRLFRSLDEEDRKLFNFDLTELNWRYYIQNVHIPGVKKYILKMEQDAPVEVEETPSVQLEVETINELLSLSASRYPHKTALQIKRDGEWQRFSYEGVKQTAERIGRYFIQMGFRKGDRVVLYSENQPEWGISYLGSVAAGLVVVPLDPQTPYWEVWSVARFTEARAILASESRYESLPSESLQENELSERPIHLLNVNKFCAPFGPEGGATGSPLQTECRGEPVAPPLSHAAPEPIGPDDLASIIFTTSTAVDPKGAMHTHRNFLNNLFGVNRYLPIYETDHLLSVLPLYHALEFTCGFLMAIYGGATVTYIRSLKPKVILETMRETGTSCMLGVPTLYALIRDDIERRILRTSKSGLKSNFLETSKQFSRSVEQAFGRNIGRHLFSRIHQEFGGKIRVFVSGGSALGEELYDDFKALGMPIYEGYGLTETAPVLTVNPLKRSRRGSAGKPLPGVELRIHHTDKNGIGEIIVRTPSLMLAYCNNAAATAKVVRDGWFHTGDLGWVDEDGYLYITGRIKDVIVTGAGKNVYPSDVEAIYKRIPQIQEICVLGIRNELTEDIHAVIVPNAELLKDEQGEEVKKTIQRQIQQVAKAVPSYQRLQFTHIWMDPLPRKESGSVDREAVRARLLEQLGDRTPRPALPSPVRQASREEELLDELSRLSHVPREKINRESHLQSDLGLDSLMTLELLLFLEHRFGISIPDEKAPDVHTVGELLKTVRKALRAPAAQEAAAPLQLPSTLPYSQRSAVDRCLLSCSFSGLRALYKSYFDLHLRNSESLPQGRPYIIAANHCSHLDTGAIISALSAAKGIKEAQKLHVVGAGDYFFDTPLKRWFFTTFLNVVPIEREETSLAGLRLVKRILSSGEPVLIFPEGTRSRSGELQMFKPGLGLIALELDVPIVPAYIEGAFESMPAGKMIPKPSRIQVVFGAPISMGQYRSTNGDIPRDELYRQIAADVRAAIEQLRHRS